MKAIGIFILVALISSRPLKAEMPPEPSCADRVRDAALLIDGFYRDGLIRARSLSLMDKLLGQSTYDFVAAGAAAGMLMGARAGRAMNRQAMEAEIAKNKRLVPHLEYDVKNYHKTIADAELSRKSAMEQGHTADKLKEWDQIIAAYKANLVNAANELMFRRMAANEPLLLRSRTDPQMIKQAARGMVKGGFAGAAASAAARVWLLTSVSEKCGIKISGASQAKELLKYTDVALIGDDCRFTREGLRHLLSREGVSAAEACDQIPHLAEFAQKQLNQHFADVARFAAPQEVKPSCDRGKPTKVSFKIHGSPSVMNFEQTEDNEFRYVIHVATEAAPLRYVVATDKDQKSMSTVISPGVYPSNDWPSVEANKFVLYFVDTKTPPTDMFLKRRFQVGENLFYAQAAWAEAADDCKKAAGGGNKDPGGNGAFK